MRFSGKRSSSFFTNILGQKKAFKTGWSKGCGISFLKSPPSKLTYMCTRVVQRESFEIGVRKNRRSYFSLI